MTEITALQFAQEIILKIHIFKVCSIYQPELDRDDESDISNISNNFSRVSKRLLQKYCNFFNIFKTVHPSQQHETDHVIKLKPNTEPPFMQIYNLSPAELKALDKYINEALVNK